MGIKMRNEKRKVVATTSAGAAGAVASLGAVLALGSVTGLSATGITSGLAAIGRMLGGGMLTGLVVTCTAPLVVAGTAYGLYTWIED